MPVPITGLYIGLTITLAMVLGSHAGMMRGRTGISLLDGGNAFAAEKVRRREPALAVKPGSGQSFRDCADCPEMVVVPAGNFMMGSNDGGSDEKPVHEVRFVKPFAVGKFEVTWDEWDTCVRADGCDNGPVERAGGDNGWGKGRRPIIEVDWKDAKAYAAWLSKKTGKTYRLLTEAEWEYAARAGTTTRYSWGNSIDCGKAAYDGGKGSACNHKVGGNYRGTQRVGNYDANGWGLHDMHGNVWEWTEDCWNDSYADKPEELKQFGKAWTSGNCSRRAVRGGSWFDFPDYLRSSLRVGVSTVDRYAFNGFRLGRTLTP